MLGIYCRTSKEQDIETSTIIQQRTSGIKFAEEYKFNYELYEDEGKSGYKISDDDQDPFNNRPDFTRLINDIKNKKVDKVWVWEHSRLSRNQYASAFIFNIFEKHKITLYENNKELKIDDPQFKFMRQMLDAVAEYERQLIVARTTRGKHKRIDEGNRVYQKLFGYTNSGRNEKGYVIWKPVESEIETYQFISKRFLEGATLKKICNEVYQAYHYSERKLFNYAKFYGRILRGYQYTGYQLTIEGTELYKKFRKNEIESLKILLDRKYWIKSNPFPLELITIEDWVKMGERLQINSKKYGRGSRILKADKDIATGLVECGICGMRYYSRELKYTNRKGEEVIYRTYYHSSIFAEEKCKQRPKSFNIDHLDNIFKILFFFFYIVFDNTGDLIKESQRNIRQIQLKLKEKITKLEKDISIVEKRILKFKKALDNSADEIEVIKVLSKQISANEEELENKNIEVSKTKIDYELQNEKFNQTLLEMTYYDVKEKVNDWFFKLSVEEQRNELIRVIKKCLIFNHYILIDTGKIVFIFDILKKEVFDINLLNNLNKDEVYKKYFVEMKGKREARKFNEKLIHEVNLKRDKEIRMRVFQYLLKTYNINYDISEHDKLISFVPLSGIMSLEVETFKD